MVRGIARAEQRLEQCLMDVVRAEADLRRVRAVLNEFDATDADAICDWQP